jgi:hypothetical protein
MFPTLKMKHAMKTEYRNSSRKYNPREIYVISIPEPNDHHSYFPSTIRVIESGLHFGNFIEEETEYKSKQTSLHKIEISP